jgi:hypothetical protein
VICIFLFAGVWVYLRWMLEPVPPKVTPTVFLQEERVQVEANHFQLGNNFLRKNEWGIWEEYVEGEAFERGVVLGKLNKELLHKQELAFVQQIDSFIPNKFYQHFLSIFIRFFNRDLSKYFPIENQKEIYGESLFAPQEFNHIAAPFDRMLHYHAAHDLGHALLDFSLVGCTSFAIWGKNTEDSSLIIGRNLDFSLGDKFAEDKIVLFVKPDSGYRFAMITWAGFVGSVSGMNEHGLTVTINAAKSDVPKKATTPVALVARQILQYAKNIGEAFEIAKQYPTFVCEIFMIGSHADGRAALIEKSISKTVLFHTDTTFVVCANHYQSKDFEQDKNNIENIKNSTSAYRQQRMLQLLHSTEKFSPQAVCNILRHQKGLNDKHIGIGNEKAINQLISHHAVIFAPQQRLMWVSAHPYQLGAFVCYDLNKIFFDENFRNTHVLYLSEKTIAPDTFLHTAEWKNFLRYKEMKQTLHRATSSKKTLPNEASFIAEFIETNPHLWETYAMAGKYFMALNKTSAARKHLEMALQKEVASRQDAEKIAKWISNLSR